MKTVMQTVNWNTDSVTTVRRCRPLHPGQFLSKKNLLICCKNSGMFWGAHHSIGKLSFNLRTHHPPISRHPSSGPQIQRPFGSNSTKSKPVLCWDRKEAVAGLREWSQTLEGFLQTSGQPCGWARPTPHFSLWRHLALLPPRPFGASAAAICLLPYWRHYLSLWFSFLSSAKVIILH